MKIVKLSLLILVFFKEFILSNLSVAYTVLFVKRSKINPKFILYDAVDLSYSERIFLSQMITLTPGTITVKINEDGKLLIHVLDGINSEKIIKRIEEKLKNALIGVTR